jgi:hypothetical protein
MTPSPTPCRHMVSELFHSPHRGAFHLSLTVLCTIGLRKYVALPVSSGRFAQAIRVLSYSRALYKLHRFRLRGFHPLGRCFPAASANFAICNLSCVLLLHSHTNNVLQPREFTKRLLLRAVVWQILRFGLGSCSLAATNEIPIGFFSSWY